MNKLIKPAKRVLAERFGYKNVSVKNGSGTAWGWVECTITTKKPIELECTGDNPFICSNCRKNYQLIRQEAYQLMYRAWQQEGLKPYTYTADDGYDTQRDDVLIDINFI